MVHWANAQSTRYTYTVEPNSNSQIMQSIFKNYSQNIKAHLLINASNQYFYLTQDGSIPNEDYELLKISVDSNGSIYKPNSSEFEYILPWFSKNEKKMIKTKFKTNWILTNETKKINGYTCYKATCTLEQLHGNDFVEGQNLTAWYTKEIAVLSGPKCFSNLPGFIVQLSTSTLTYTLSKTEQTNDPIPIELELYKIYTFDQYYNSYKKP